MANIEPNHLHRFPGIGPHLWVRKVCRQGPWQANEALIHEDETKTADCLNEWDLEKALEGEEVMDGTASNHRHRFPGIDPHLWEKRAMEGTYLANKAQKHDGETKTGDCLYE